MIFNLDKSRLLTSGNGFVYKARLTLSQTTNFGLFQTERHCSNVMKMGV